MTLAPTPSARARLAVPAAVAALLPVASQVAVWLAAPENAAPDLGALAFSAVWAAVPFVMIAGLVATTASLRPAFGLAAGVGLALTAAGWGWATWGRIRAPTASSGAGVEAGLLMLALPVAVVSVMITVIAVRSAFAGGPPR